MRLFKCFLCFLTITLLIFSFPNISYAQEIKDVPLGSEHQGTVVNESVTKTETKVIKEEVKEVLEENKTDPVISSNSSTLLEQIKSLWQKTVEVVVNTIDAVFPFLNPKRAEEDKPKSNQIIIDSLAGAITPAYNIYKLYINISTPKPKAKPQVPQAPTPTVTETKQTIEVTQKFLDSLGKSDINRFSKFVYENPYDDNIPEKAKEVYEFTNTWNPDYHPQNYLQCTAFVYMVYNMNGIKLPLGLGNARDWDNTSNPVVSKNFDVYTTGKDSEPIQEGDIMVWDDDPLGHVGIVKHIDNTDKVFEIVSANSTKVSDTFRFTIKDNGIINIESSKNWIPDHWMRLKKD